MPEPPSKVMISAALSLCEANELCFPESELASVSARPPTALCFSGGGSRSMSACIGYLRGLLAAGLLDRVRYISCVSGGSWAGSIFVYYRRGPRDDAALLDLGLSPGSPPAELSLARLAAPLPDDSMASVITADLLKWIVEDLREQGAEDSWNRAVAKLYLEPFGLVADDPLAPCFDADMRDRILARPDNQSVPGLEPENFIFPRADRPFLVINACIVEPGERGLIAPERAVSLQFTPLYIGSPQRIELRCARKPLDEQTVAVGGCFVEPFGFGGAEPVEVGPDMIARIPLAPLEIEQRQTLMFAVGSSSAAYAAVADAIPGLNEDTQVTPVAPYWAVHDDEIVAARIFDVADGGVLENYGLLPMLQRGVERAVVFINTCAALDLAYEPFAGDQPTDASGKIDVYLPNLFGVQTRSIGTIQAANTVFTFAAYAELVAALHACKRDGRPLVVRQRLEVQANEWWGIPGGWSVEVVWVYLERVPKWEALLPADTRDAIEQGNRRLLKTGPLQHFPHYSTAGENALKLVALTETQIRAEAALAEWVIGDALDVFESVLRVSLPPAACQ